MAILRHLEAEALHEPLRLIHHRRHFLETERRRHRPPVRRRRPAGGVVGRRRRRQAPAGAVRPQGGTGAFIPPLLPALADGERQLQPVLLPRRRRPCAVRAGAGDEDEVISGEAQVQHAAAAPDMMSPAADELRWPRQAAAHQLLLDAVEAVQFVDLFFFSKREWQSNCEKFIRRSGLTV